MEKDESERWRLRAAAMYAAAVELAKRGEGGFDIAECMGMSEQDMQTPLENLIAQPWSKREVQVIDWQFVCERLEDWLLQGPGLR